MNGGEVLFHYVASPQEEIKALNQIDFSVLAKRDRPIKRLYFLQTFDWLVPYH